MEFQVLVYRKENYNSTNADVAGNYLFTKTLDPMQYYNFNLKLPQLQPNVTTKLPFQDDFVCFPRQDATSNVDCFQDLQLNLT
jgi:hypothetical protein